jgi:hypothetical protein
MTRARLDLSDFEGTPASKDTTKLREISEGAGFPSRPAVTTPPAPVVERPPAVAPGFQRPARPTGNRHIAINVRVDPETAEKIYALRDADPSRKQAIADVVEEAIQLLHSRQFPTAD